MPVIKDVVCSLCGCLCDDITVTVEDNKIMGVKKMPAFSVTVRPLEYRLMIESKHP